ncbi:MAG: polysaccharide deacetylase family protein [Syntrophobacteraceae bacterium]
MSDKVKGLLRRMIHISGVNTILRLIHRSYPRIIMFHQIQPAGCRNSKGLPAQDFLSYLKYIKKHFDPIKITDLVSYKHKNGVFPSNAVAITFDDGYRSFYDLAWPLLKRMEMPATVFVIPQLVRQDAWLWPDRVAFLYESGYGKLTSESLTDLISRLKTMAATERNSFIGEIQTVSGISLPGTIPEDYRLMSWEQLREICQSGLIEIGSHTLTHPILTNESLDTCWAELLQSRLILQAELGIPASSFCYPNGQPGDYSLEHCEMLGKAGYTCGIASHFGFVTAKSNIMCMPRITGDHEDIYSFYKYLDGFEYMMRLSAGCNCETCLQNHLEHHIRGEHCNKCQCSG